MKFFPGVIAPFALFALFAMPVNAGDPAALVEDIADSHTDVMFMDLVEEGKKIQLATGEKLVLSYLSSCRQETITGGTVTVGKVESKVVGGQISAKTVPCDTAEVTSAGAEAGAVVFRARPDGTDLPEPAKTIYSLYPILRTSAEISEVKLTRLDIRATPELIKLRNGVADMRKLKKRLARKALYLAEAGDRKIVFLVHPKAKSTERAVLSRLIEF
jgi:hypothetical protein